MQIDDKKLSQVPPGDTDGPGGTDGTRGGKPQRTRNDRDFYDRKIGDEVEVPEELPTTKDTPKPQPPAQSAGTNRTGSATQEEIDAAAAFWSQDLLANGSQGFMDALLRGDSDAKAALKSPEFMMLLQTKIKEENQYVSMVSNLLEALHSTAKAAISSIRV